MFDAALRYNDYFCCCRWLEKRHIQVKGTYSPDDQQLEKYGEMRKSKALKQLTRFQRIMAYKQKGVCPLCLDDLMNGEELHERHIIPRKNKGGNNPKNLTGYVRFDNRQKRWFFRCAPVDPKWGARRERKEFFL